MSIQNEQTIYVVMKNVGDDSYPVEAWRSEVDADDQVSDFNDNLTSEEAETTHYDVETIILKGWECGHVDR